MCRIEAVNETHIDDLCGPFRRNWRADMPPEIRHASPSLFVYELWPNAHTDVNDRYECLMEMEQWLTETNICHVTIVLSLSTRLIAIQNRDEAFMFAMRYR